MDDKGTTCYFTEAGARLAQQQAGGYKARDVENQPPEQMEDAGRAPVVEA